MFSQGKEGQEEKLLNKSRAGAEQATNREENSSLSQGLSPGETSSPRKNSVEDQAGQTGGCHEMLSCSSLSSTCGKQEVAWFCLILFDCWCSKVTGSQCKGLKIISPPASPHLIQIIFKAEQFLGRVLGCVQRFPGAGAAVEVSL